MGVESWNAVCTPMAALVAPGLRHEGRAAFLPVDDEPDPVAVGVEAVEHGQIALARNPEGQLHTLRHQAFDDEMPR
jgi:hypothetical protein